MINTKQSPANMTTLSPQRAIADLITQIDPAVFLEKFGSPVSALDTLLEAKTVTIGKLMEITPPGVIDPTPFLYDSSFYTIAAAIGGFQNFTFYCILRHLSVELLAVG